MTTTPTRLALGLLASITWLTSARADDPPATVRLATFNIHHAEGEDGKLDLDRVADVVRGADIIAFQEVDVRFRARSQFVDQAEALGKRLGGHFAFGGNLIDGDGQYGVALVTRFPILAQQNHPLPRSPGREKAEPRGLLAVTLDVEGRPLRVYVTHLAHDSPADRTLQVARVRATVAAEPGPFVVMGDFNLRPDSADYAALLAPTRSKPLLVDAWAKIGQGDGFTIGHTEKTRGRIDYVLVSPDLAAGLIETRVDQTTRASDHQPVFAALRLPAR